MEADLQSETTAWFRSLEPIPPVEMVGLWKGVGIPSNHPLDGVLENLHWFGKRFHPDMRADPLVFQWRSGRLVSIEPSCFPIGLAIRAAPFARTSLARYLSGYLQKVVRARGSAASLRLETFEDVTTAAMVYDAQPVVDYFRRLNDDEVAGMMCVRDDARRYFFKLTRTRRDR